MEPARLAGLVQSVRPVAVIACAEGDEHS